MFFLPFDNVQFSLEYLLFRPDSTKSEKRAYHDLMSKGIGWKAGAKKCIRSAAGHLFVILAASGYLAGAPKDSSTRHWVFGGCAALAWIYLAMNRHIMRVEESIRLADRYRGFPAEPEVWRFYHRLEHRINVLFHGTQAQALRLDLFLTVWSIQVNLTMLVERILWWATATRLSRAKEERIIAETRGLIAHARSLAKRTV